MPIGTTRIGGSPVGAKLLSSKVWWKWQRNMEIHLSPERVKNSSEEADGFRFGLRVG